MTSEGLGEMFEGDSAETCAGKFSLMSMVAERRVSRAQTRERGPHRRERKFLYVPPFLKKISVLEKEDYFLAEYYQAVPLGHSCHLGFFLIRRPY